MNDSKHDQALKIACVTESSVNLSQYLVDGEKMIKETTLDDDDPVSGIFKT